MPLSVVKKINMILTFRVRAWPDELTTMFSVAGQSVSIGYSSSLQICCSIPSHRRSVMTTDVVFPTFDWYYALLMHNTYWGWRVMWMIHFSSRRDRCFRIHRPRYAMCFFKRTQYPSLLVLEISTSSMYPDHTDRDWRFPFSGKTNTILNTRTPIAFIQIQTNDNQLVHTCTDEVFHDFQIDDPYIQNNKN